MDEVVVSLSNVSKCFKRYAHPAERLKETFLPGKSRAEAFWALQNISLQMQKGETVGILGRNGSGKSTLLQIIAGTLTPTSGDVRVQGRVSALLELGSGFDPEFSGRQNVFFKGRILGLSQAEIARKFEQIAAFAEIGDFIDQPVKTYSSGMFVRLAFAVAIHVEPEILIVDEALAVGDIFFQQKCVRCLEELRASGVTIIFVSHDSQAVVKLCDRAFILQNGQLVDSGSPAAMVARYTEMYYEQSAPQRLQPRLIASQTSSTNNSLPNLNNSLPNLDASIPPLEDIPQGFVCEFADSHRYGELPGLIVGVAIADRNGNPKTIFQVGEEILLSVKVGEHSAEICPLNIGFQVKNRLGQVCIGTNTCLLATPPEPAHFSKPFICQFRFRLLIFPETYTIMVAIAEHQYAAQIVYDWIETAGIIDVVTDGYPTQTGLCFPDIQVNTI